MENRDLPAARQRHFGMDWLRIGAFGLLIFYHIGMYYVPWDWHVKAQPVLDWVEIPMLATNAWRLSLLFVVSGFASAAMLAKRPAVGAFLRNRSARLLVPLAFGIAFVIPVQPWIELQGKYGYAHGFLHFWGSDYFRFGALHGIILPTWQHLWFVAYLWVYTLALAALLALFRPHAGRAAQSLFDAVFGRPILLALLPIAWLLVLWLLLWPGARETHALVDDLPAHAHYFPAFLFGFALQGSGPAWRAIRSVWKPALLLGMLAYAGVALLELRQLEGGAFPAMLFTGLRAVNGWLVIVGLIGFADRMLDRDWPGRTMLNEAIFPFYIVHQTIIVVVGWWCLRAGIPNLASFPILLAATIAGCWLFYRVGREIPVLRLLIGLRGWRPPHAPPAGGG